MTELVWPDEDPRWRDDAATVPHGPRRHEPGVLPRPAPARGPRRPSVLLATTALATTALVTVWWLATGSPDPVTGDVAPSPCPTTSTSASIGDPSLQTVVVDDGTPCPSSASYDRRTAVIDLGARGRYRLGEPGDVLLVGDWDCDGTSSPALYRPIDGHLYRFDAWAAGSPTASAAAEVTVPDGEARVVHRDGCDHLVVEAPA